MATQGSIPALDIAPLFERPSRSRDVLDRQILAAAAETGFMTIRGFPGNVGAATRRQLLRLFGAPDTVLDKLTGNKKDPLLPLVYRGWFGLREDRASYFEGIEIGPDVAYGESACGSIDPLLGSTPMPSEGDLPGWRNAVRDYYLQMERIPDY